MRRYLYTLLVVTIMLGFGISETAMAGEQRTRGSRQSKSKSTPSKKQAEPRRERSKAKSSRSERTRRENKSSSARRSSRSRNEEKKARPQQTRKPAESRASRGSSQHSSSKPSGYSTRTRRSEPQQRKAEPRRDRSDRSASRAQPSQRSGSHSTYTRPDPRRRTVEPQKRAEPRRDSRYTPRVNNPTTRKAEPRTRSRTVTPGKSTPSRRDSSYRGRVSRGEETAGRERSVRGRDSSSRRDSSHTARSAVARQKYDRSITVRSRSGEFDYKHHDRAVRDRERVGRISLSYRQGSSGYNTPNVKVKGGKYARYIWARPEYVRDDFRLVNIVNNTYHINRHYLIDHDGRWGRAHHRYDGRNWHFYLSLRNSGFRFEVGYDNWNRRYYGDGWSTRFGWSSSACFPTGNYSVGTYYFEPNYAFSFTFNHGYEAGYIEGYNRAIEDWNYYRPYNSNYHHASGYFEALGPYYEYVDGYDQGFSQGYYAAYSGLPYGWENFGFGDFREYPVIYDFDYDYFDRNAGYYYDEPYEYDYNY